MLIIDPQNDFCDLPIGYSPGNPGDIGQFSPSLPVPGAHEDMVRVANIISQAGLGITEISVTLDSHHRIDIAHPGFWVDRNRKEVMPFTQISFTDVCEGNYLPRLPNVIPRVLSYLNQLESSGRYRLMVWPIHCEIGSWGQNVHFDVRTAYNLWEEKTLRKVNKIFKGSNPWTEHYSAIKSEVPDIEDKKTQLNIGLLASLSKADRIYIAGEAGSHCVKATTEDIVDYLSPDYISKLVIIADCISPVSGFEIQQQKFFKSMKERGVRISNSAEVLIELQDNNCLKYRAG